MKLFIFPPSTESGLFLKDLEQSLRILSFDSRLNLILSIAKEIIEPYKTNPEVQKGGCILPVLNNQKSNAFLKQIALLCGITKPLTTHLARQTFATTLTLTKGVPIESVSKMLGHEDLRTTQHYAKNVDC